jgi:putative chitobiose transport system substrate-binding protein
MNKSFFTVILTTLILVTGTFFFFKKPVEKNNEVVFWTLQMSDFAPYIKGVISEFEAQNPNVKIKWVDVPFSEGEKRTLASVLSDNPPDLVNLNPDFSATLAHKGALYEIPQNKLEQFNSSILKSLEYNNKIYSLPSLQD